MRKLLLVASLITASLFPVPPAQANSQAESCLNQLLQSKIPDLQGAEATLLASVNHNGYDYHWIEASKGTGIFQSVELVIMTDTRADCKMLLFNFGGPLPTEAHYDDALGVEVGRKFKKAFRDNPPSAPVNLN